MNAHPCCGHREGECAKRRNQVDAILIENERQIHRDTAVTSCSSLFHCGDDHSFCVCLINHWADWNRSCTVRSHWNKSRRFHPSLDPIAMRKDSGLIGCIVVAVRIVVQCDAFSHGSAPQPSSMSCRFKERPVQRSEERKTKSIRLVIKSVRSKKKEARSHLAPIDNSSRRFMSPCFSWSPCRDPNHSAHFYRQQTGCRI